MEPIATLLNKYFDKKRKYEYYRIAHLIEEENKQNPNRPPKGIVGERPSPVNSQETQKEQESPDTVKRIRNIQILKDLSWLNKSTQILKKKNDVSCTLQEICKQLGNVALEQSSLLISQEKGDEIKLNKFLAYINQQTLLKTQHKDKTQQIQKQITKLSQPHEQLIQTLNQKQNEENKQRFGSQYSKQNTDLALQMNKIQRDINVNFIKNQVDSLLKNKQSNENLQTKVDLQDNQTSNSKSKTIVQHQPKISTQLFLTNLRKNFQSIPQIPNSQNQNPILSPTQNHNKQKTQTNNNQISIGKLNLKQISKLFIEEDPTEQELKWKNGSQTHRPLSSTKNFFSNRNSPTVSRGVQQEQKNSQMKQTSGLISAYSQIQQQQSQKSIKAAGSSTNRKTTQPNIHIRYTSNQDKIININININDNLQNQKQLKQTKHKKNQSEGKPIHLNTPLLEAPQNFVCLTDRAGQGEFQFKNSIAASCQNSPKTQKLKRVGSGLSSLKNSGSTKNSFIQQMVTQVSKQQQRQDFFSSQFRKPY
ncbi:unnamed protein product [Paramecium sonneborni]|uniref:Uncharacterized protein n=1 Tax=Paramecium sonneborni TaxID=65129 RepID=A0A8S1QAU0_9CILI|nr:unnamed protein product [Paramecium sonneborni]